MSETERAGTDARSETDVPPEDKRPALHVLTPAQRDAYEAVRMGDQTPTEYARNTDRSKGTISNLLGEAERRLKIEELEQKLEESA